MIAISFARGIGFGLLGVVTGALVAMLLPPDRRGEGLGLLGIVDGVPAVVALPAGVWITGHYGYTVLVIVTWAVALLPLALVTGSIGELLAGMIVFGAGFGIIENTIFVLLIESMPASGAGLASALWNLAYDAGYGAGPAVFGLIVVRTGYRPPSECRAWSSSPSSP
jgi:predicted MFS family arabinose efflux permease